MTTTAGSKSTWVDALHNPKSVEALYSRAPEFVECLRVALDREGPRIDLIGILDRFPDNPPRKWKDAGSNVAVITLRIEGLSKLTVVSWTTSNRGSLSLTREADNRIAFAFQNESGPLITGTGLVVHVAEFGHYFDPSM